MATTFAMLEGLVIFATVCMPDLLAPLPIPPIWLAIAATLVQTLTITGSFVLAFYYNDLYDLISVRTLRHLRQRLPQAVAVMGLFLVTTHLALTAIGLAPISATSGLQRLAIALGIVLLLRVGLYATIRARLFTKRVMILGTGELARELASNLTTPRHPFYTIVGHVSDERPACGETGQTCLHLGPLDLLSKFIEQLQPDIIIAALTERRQQLPMGELLESRVNGIIVEDGIDTYERCTGKLAIERMVPSDLVFSKDFIKPKWLMWMRRALSFSLATIGFVLTVPLMCLIAIAIKLDSAGPALFVQNRTGLRGQTFPLIKFRTMHPPYFELPATPSSFAPTGTHAADVELGAAVFQRDESLRVTRVGKWLRRFYLDELPQFVNILRGDMDLVGPRPEMTTNVKPMTELIPYYALRTTVRPGLTGWAQIKYGYAVSQAEVTEKMRYDLYYIKHLSIKFDIQIILDTVKSTLLRRGT